MIENNRVQISGEIMGNFQFHHEVYGKGFYVTEIASRRLSGTDDSIPIMVSERLVDVNQEWGGETVKISGNFRSYNAHNEGNRRLILSVFAREFEPCEPAGDDENGIFLSGYICKDTIYRKTPLGREIANFLLAVNRPYGKSDYIPCICWGRDARFVGNLKVGDRCEVFGRIQSREYKKRISEDEYENRVAYEVSGRTIQLIAEDKGERR